MLQMEPVLQCGHAATALLASFRMVHRGTDRGAGSDKNSLTPHRLTIDESTGRGVAKA
jgi:hypothetical protein